MVLGGRASERRTQCTASEPVSLSLSLLTISCMSSGDRHLHCYTLWTGTCCCITYRTQVLSAVGAHSGTARCLRQKNKADNCLVSVFCLTQNERWTRSAGANTLLSVPFALFLTLSSCLSCRWSDCCRSENKSKRTNVLATEWSSKHEQGPRHDFRGSFVWPCSLIVICATTAIVQIIQQQFSLLSVTGSMHVRMQRKQGNTALQLKLFFD